MLTLGEKLPTVKFLKFCTMSVLYILPVPVALCHCMLRMHNRPLKAFWGF